MDKKIEISWLLDFYGKLLTDKQFNVMTTYFYEDASLSEIAEDMGVSRQAVHDIIGRGEALLFEYEDKLGLLKQFQFMKESLEGINKRLRKCSSEEEKQNICDEIDKLIIRWEE